MTVILSVDTLVVSLDGNPITSLSLWQHYAIVKLNLISLNNEKVRKASLVATTLMASTPCIRLHQSNWQPASIYLGQ